MKKFEVWYKVDGKRMKKTVKAENKEEAMEKIRRQHSWFGQPNIVFEFVVEV